MMTDFNNGLTNAETERLSMLAEECGEVVQLIGKILRHGYTSYHPEDADMTTNWTLLNKELNDIGAVVHGMIKSGDYDEADFSLEIQKKIWQKKLRWTHHQKGEQTKSKLIGKDDA
jgi:NTP pyrophosphatase (non-canonical NTP hydrolase)